MGRWLMKQAVLPPRTAEGSGGGGGGATQRQPRSCRRCGCQRLRSCCGGIWLVLLVRRAGRRWLRRRRRKAPGGDGGVREEARWWEKGWQTCPLFPQSWKWRATCSSRVEFAKVPPHRVMRGRGRQRRLQKVGPGTALRLARHLNRQGVTHRPRRRSPRRRPRGEGCSLRTLRTRLRAELAPKTRVLSRG